MLDVAFLVLTLALFALFALLAKALERTVPGARGPARCEAMPGEERG